MRIAVVSPFVDRHHGTERAIAELLERLANNFGCEVHLYAQRVEDLALSDPAKPRDPNSGALFWHRVPSIPGPHLLRFLCWLFLNWFWRAWDRQVRGLSFDLVFSPGINSFRADAVIVHALFCRLRELSSEETIRTPEQTGAFRRLHRRAYYALLAAMEGRMYTDHRVSLAAVSRRTGDLLAHYFSRYDVRVIPNGVDTAQFFPLTRLARRAEARLRHDFQEKDFVLLLVGNDWRVKGLPAVLEAMAACADLPIRLLVAGQDALGPHQALAKRLGTFDRCRWAQPCPDALSFYAAADAYVSPTLEDAFALPPLEAMACGLPVITSVNNGGSQIMTEGVNGFVLGDPRDSVFLARLVRQLCEQPDLCARLGENAARTAREYTWDQNAQETLAFLKSVLARKSQHRGSRERTAG